MTDQTKTETIDMNPLSRVKPGASVTMNSTLETMNWQPVIATKIMQCIAEFSQTEFVLGSALAALIGTDVKIGLMMYSSAASRKAQFSMLNAAAEATLQKPDHLDVYTILMGKVVSPAMKERDKLAHWPWGHSSGIPDALLLIDPTPNLLNLGSYFLQPKQRGSIDGRVLIERPTMDRTRIFVVKDKDVERTFLRIQRAKTLVGNFISTLARYNSPAEHVEYLQRLSNEPEIREPLERLRRSREESQSSPASIPQSEPKSTR